MVGGGGDSGYSRSDDAAMASSFETRWIFRVVRSAAASESETGFGGAGRASAGFVSGKILGFQCATFPREVDERAWDSAQLHVGEEGIAGGSCKNHPVSRAAPKASAAPAATRNVAAY